MGFQIGLNGLHAARLAVLELEEDLDYATILPLLTVAVIVLILWMTYRNAILKTVVSVCKSMPGACLKYTIRFCNI